MFLVTFCCVIINCINRWVVMGSISYTNVGQIRDLIESRQFLSVQDLSALNTQRDLRIKQLVRQTFANLGWSIRKSSWNVFSWILRKSRIHRVTKAVKAAIEAFLKKDFSVPTKETPVVEPASKQIERCFMGLYPKNSALSQTLFKLLPTQHLQSFLFKEGESEGEKTFDFRYEKASTAVIDKVGEKGWKLAQGAKFRTPERLRGVLSSKDHSIVFQDKIEASKKVAVLGFSKKLSMILKGITIREDERGNPIISLIAGGNKNSKWDVQEFIDTFSCLDWVK